MKYWSRTKIIFELPDPPLGANWVPKISQSFIERKKFAANNESVGTSRRRPPQNYFELQTGWDEKYIFLFYRQKRIFSKSFNLFRVLDLCYILWWDGPVGVWKSTSWFEVRRLKAIKDNQDGVQADGKFTQMQNKSSCRSQHDTQFDKMELGFFSGKIHMKFMFPWYKRKRQKNLSLMI